MSKLDKALASIAENAAQVAEIVAEGRRNLSSKEKVIEINKQREFKIPKRKSTSASRTLSL